MAPQTRYARSGDLHIAYQVVGDGPIDLVYVPSWISAGRALLGGAERRAVLQPAGLVLAPDHVRPPRLRDVRPACSRAPTLEEQMDDVVAVMDAAGSERAAVFALLEGGAMAALFAATHPERTSALVLYEAQPRMSWAPDYDWALRREERERYRQQRRPRHVGRRLADPRAVPELGRQPAAAQLVRAARAARGEPGDGREADADERAGRRPGRAARRSRCRRWSCIAAGDKMIDIRHSRYLAEHIPGARLVELPRRRGALVRPGARPRNSTRSRSS